MKVHTARKSRIALLFVVMTSCAPVVPVECVLLDFSDWSEEPILSADFVINGVEDPELASMIAERFTCNGASGRPNHAVICRRPRTEE